MSAEEFISSGIIEQYVIGTASPEEIHQVDEMRELYPAQINAEIEAIELALQSLAMKGAVQPPSRLKETLMNQITTSDKYSDSEESNIEEPTPIRPIGKTETISGGNGGRTLLFWWAAAASLILLISVSGNLLFYKKLKNMQGQIADLRESKDVLANNMQTQETFLKELQSNLTNLIQPGTQPVELKGTDNQPAALATVYWNKEKNTVLLNVQDLNALPTSKQYQLWALVDGKPVNAGVFDKPTDQTALLHLNSISKADAFAVTIEPAGGSAQPTLSTMCLYGKLG